MVSPKEADAIAQLDAQRQTPGSASASRRLRPVRAEKEKLAKLQEPGQRWTAQVIRRSSLSSSRKSYKKYIVLSTNSPRTLRARCAERRVRRGRRHAEWGTGGRPDSGSRHGSREEHPGPVRPRDCGAARRRRVPRLAAARLAAQAELVAAPRALCQDFPGHRKQTGRAAATGDPGLRHAPGHRQADVPARREGVLPQSSPWTGFPSSPRLCPRTSRSASPTRSPTAAARSSPSSPASIRSRTPRASRSWDRTRSRCVASASANGSFPPTSPAASTP